MHSKGFSQTSFQIWDLKIGQKTTLVVSNYLVRQIRCKHRKNTWDLTQQSPWSLTKTIGSHGEAGKNTFSTYGGLIATRLKKKGNKKVYKPTVLLIKVQKPRTYLFPSLTEGAK